MTRGETGHQTESTPESLWQASQSGVRPRLPLGKVDPGERLGGRYRLLGQIGSGPSGRVYRAEQLPQGRLVAVKVLAQELAGEPQVRSRFLLEAAVCAQLSHPNVVELLDYGRTDDDSPLCYVAMELVQGETLGEYLRRQGPLSAPEALRIARQIGRALRAAHKLGLVHRDLRPGNVMVSESDGMPRVKVLDFALARTREEARDPGGKDLRWVGSHAYAAPEQLAGEEADRRADIYALGVMLYEMLTGALPFQAQGGAQWLQVKGRGDLPPMPASVPAELRALVARCLMPRPEERWTDIVALMGAMRVLVTGDPQLSPRDLPDVPTEVRGILSLLPSLPDNDLHPERRARRPVDRWSVVVVVLLLTAAAAGGMLVSQWLERSSRPTVEPIESSP